MFLNIELNDLYVLLQLLFPWIVILTGAIIAILIAGFIKNKGATFVFWLAVITIILGLVGSWVNWINAGKYSDVLEIGASGVFFIFDKVTYLTWMAVLLAALFSILLAVSFLKLKNIHKPEYYALILLCVFGAGVVFASGNLLSLYIGLETMSITAYILTGFIKDKDRSNEAAIKYFLMGGFASAFLLFGIAFIFGSTGSLNLETLYHRIPEILVSGDERYFCLFGMAMLLIGICFKSAVVPFHAWSPDVYDGAPIVFTNFMATAIKTAAIVAFLRLTLFIFQATGSLWIYVISTLSILTMFIGNLAALKQANLKRMLAYSSIAHVGYILVGFPGLIKDPLTNSSAIIFYLIAYVFMTTGAFSVLAAMQKGEKEITDIKDFSSLGRKRPFLAFIFSLFLLSLLGVPPLVGFFGKYYLFLNAAQSGFMWLVVIALVNTVISAYYYLRPIIVMYFYYNEGEVYEPISHTNITVLILAGLAVLYFGIFPTDLLTIVINSF